jgi:hypothetical protein
LPFLGYSLLVVSAVPPLLLDELLELDDLDLRLTLDSLLLVRRRVLTISFSRTLSGYAWKSSSP